MKKILFVLTSALLVLVSCEDSFEVKYTSQLTGSNAASMVDKDPTFLDSYVQGMYGAMCTYGVGGSDNHDDYGILSVFTNTEYMGGDVVLYGTQNWGLYDYMFDYRAFNYSRPYQLWSTFYTLISNANIIIDFFPQGEDPTNPVAKAALGQAYAVRAFSYMYEMLYFQDPCDENGDFNSEAPGVPVIFAARDGYDQAQMDLHKGRNTMGFVAEQAQLDIERAIDLLEDYARPSKNMIDYKVAQGIAARLYLFTHQWEKAAEAANAARQGYTLMNEARILSGFMDVEDTEVMWGFNHTTETQTTYASFFSHMSNDSPGYGGLNQMSKLIDAKLYSQISNTDIRKQLFNGPDGDPDAATEGASFPLAARKFGYDSQWLQDYIYMRAAEMYLNEAEALARMGDTSSAKAVLAELMETRDPLWDGEASLEDIALQRRIELWGEGFRYFDLRRTATGIERDYAGSNHNYELMTIAANVPAHDKLWVFQIPQREMQENTQLSETDQNEL